MTPALIKLAAEWRAARDRRVAFDAPVPRRVCFGGAAEAPDLAENRQEEIYPRNLVLWNPANEKAAHNLNHS